MTSTANPGPSTHAEAIDLAIAVIEDLAALGETIEDEWTYVTDLAAAGRAALRALPGDAASVLPVSRAQAVAAVAAEARRISDPHRAIDWLSSLPAIVALALAPGRVA